MNLVFRESCGLGVERIQHVPDSNSGQSKLSPVLYWTHVGGGEYWDDNLTKKTFKWLMRGHRIWLMGGHRI